MDQDKATGKTNWDKLRAKRATDQTPSEKEREQAHAYWSTADVVIPDGKTRMTVRFDSDVVEWFREQGPKYQTRMNAVLRQYMTKQQRQSDLIESSSEGQLQRTLDQSGLVREQATVVYLQALNHLGEISLMNGDPDTASSYFQKAVNIVQSSADIPDASM